MKKTRVRLEISAFMMLCVFTLSVLSINAWALQQLRINSGVNIAYVAPRVLSVSQPINQTDPSWDKEGYNATLSASAVKVESNSLSDLAGMLTDNNNDGNPDGVTYTEDDYYTAPVYRKIDNVNVDINTGEIIGRLSDPDYLFEWYGREVTLPSGYTLASGRTLTQQETFTVDVYTYYPEMYIARYVALDEVGVQRQYIHIAETLEDFDDLTLPENVTPVYVKEWYTATFEATIFNTDRSVAQNEYGIIPRSYVYDYTPLTSGSVKYLQDYYNFEKLDGTIGSSDIYGQNLSEVDSSNNSTTQQQFLDWSHNLTQAWTNSSLSSEYRKAKGVQGENYTVFIYNLLYLVKYANNDSQEMIGYGNTYTIGEYSSSATKIMSESGALITTGTENDLGMMRYESEKGGSTIGVYNQNAKGNGVDEYETLSNGTVRLKEDSYNMAGMNYGYNSNFIYTDTNNVTHKTGLYQNQFLTQIINTVDGEKRVLRDGYVGSDKYTSVFCLGSCNPWGNIYTWIFGVVVISDGTDLWAYVNFNDYEYGESDTWIISTQSEVENNHDKLISHNYVKLSYSLPTLEGYYRFFGVSETTSDSGIESLIGLPSAQSDIGDDKTGLCDYYTCDNNPSYIFGIIRGGNTDTTTRAGLFCFPLSKSFNYTYMGDGFRPALILSA